MRSSPLDIKAHATVRLHGQKDWSSLTGEAKQAFIDAATGYVLYCQPQLNFSFTLIFD